MVSLPTTRMVALGTAGLLLALGTSVATTASTASTAVASKARAPYSQPGPIHAGNTFDWGAKKWSYELEYGEAIDPWVDQSDGTGRTANTYAMLTLDSGESYKARENHGSVVTTLGRRGESYGRWEIRMRAPMWPNGGTDYRVRAELIPTTTAARACSPQAITFADFVGYAPTVDMGVQNGAQRWSFTEGGVVKNRENWHTYAVEVTKRRIAWFVDAEATATLKKPAAVSGKPLTIRLSLVAPNGTADMNRTRMGVDWVRFWSLKAKGSKAASIDRAPTPTSSSSVTC